MLILWSATARAQLPTQQPSQHAACLQPAKAFLAPALSLKCLASPFTYMFLRHLKGVITSWSHPRSRAFSVKGLVGCMSWLCCSRLPP